MYRSLEAKLHDIFWNAEAPGLELELIRQQLEGKPGKALEIGCGSGRILVPLNEAGFEVDGNDVSEDMLALLEEQRGEQKFKAFHGVTTEQDISEYRHFLVPAFTFMLFEEGEVEATLRYIRENAAEGATLYFTIFMPWAEICGELDEKQWYKDHEAESSDGSTAQCRTQFSIDRTHQMLYRKHRYTLRERNGKKEDYESAQTLRWFSYMEMCALLESTGWKVDKSVFDLDLEANSENAHLYTLTATT